jgi:hypothetical protein
VKTAQQTSRRGEPVEEVTTETIVDLEPGSKRPKT